MPQEFRFGQTAAPVPPPAPQVPGNGTHWPRMDAAPTLGRPLFVEMWAAKIRGQLQQGKTPRMPNTSKISWLYPFALERAYFVQVRNAVAPWMKMYREEVAARWERWQAARVDSAFRSDDAAEENAALFERLQAAQKAQFDGMQGGNFLAGIFGTGAKVSDFNDAQFAKYTKAVLGEQFHPNEPWVRAVVDDWAATNFSLVKSLSAEGITRLNTVVTNAVQNGLTYSEVMREMRKTEDSLSNSRARLIARDQIGKLNGKLTQRRQKDAGVEMYIWETVGDERVRGNPAGKYPKAVPSHFAIDGKVCQWDDNYVYSEESEPLQWKQRTGIMPKAVPGWEIQCRCAAIPYMEPLFQELLQEEQKLAGQNTAPVVKPPKAAKVPKVAKAPTAPDMTVFNGKHGEELHKATWATAPDWLRNAAAVTADDLQGIQYRSRGACYSSTDRVISLTTAKGQTAEHAASVFAHEYGHFMDDTMNRRTFGAHRTTQYKSHLALKSSFKEGDALYAKSWEKWRVSNVQALTDKFTADLESYANKPDAWDKAIHKRLGLGKPSDAYLQAFSRYQCSKAAYRMALDSLEQGDVYGFYRALIPGNNPTIVPQGLAHGSAAHHELLALSDIMEAASRNRLLGHPGKTALSDTYGHGASYYKKFAYRPNAEIFANFTEIYAGGDPMLVQAIERFMPETTAQYRTMVKEALK